MKQFLVKLQNKKKIGKLLFLLGSFGSFSSLVEKLLVGEKNDPFKIQSTSNLQSL